MQMTASRRTMRMSPAAQPTADTMSMRSSARSCGGRTSGNSAGFIWISWDWCPADDVLVDEVGHVAAPCVCQSPRCWVCPAARIQQPFQCWVASDAGACVLGVERAVRQKLHVGFFAHWPPRGWSASMRSPQMYVTTSGSTWRASAMRRTVPWGDSLWRRSCR